MIIIYINNPYINIKLLFFKLDILKEFAVGEDYNKVTLIRQYLGMSNTMIHNYLSIKKRLIGIFINKKQLIKEK